MARTIELILRIITEPARKELEKLQQRIEQLQKLEMLPVDKQKQAVSAVIRQFDRFQKSVEKSEQKAEKLQKALEEAGKEDPFAGVRKSLEGVESAAEQAAKAVEKAGKNVGTSFERLLKVQAILGIVEHFAQWGQHITSGSVALETATARIRTLGGEAQKLAPELEKMALSLAGSLPMSASEIADAMYNALSAGIEPSREAMEAFITTAGKLATGGMEDMSRAVDVLSGVLNAYGASAQEAARYSDILFQTVNLGKTTIPELSSSLSQVIPTAAAAGVELEQVGAALAEMTARGIPTAQAATRLNQLLVEMQKPGGELAKVLQQAGISLETLQNEELPVVLGRIQQTLAQTGKTATQVFGSSEAAAAFNALTVNLGSFEQKLHDIANASGVTEEAFATMANTTENQAKAMQAALDAFFTSLIRGTGPVGAGFQVVTQQLATIAPHVSSLLAIKELIPGSAIRSAIEGFKGLRLSALSFNAVMQMIRAHPIVAIATALTAATAGAMALYDALTTTNEELLESNKAQQEALQVQRKIITEQKEQQETASNLVKQYKDIAAEIQKGGLSAEESAKKQKQLKEIGEKLNEIYPGTVKSTASLAENLERVGQVGEEAATKLDKYSKQLTELDEQSRKLARQQIKIEAQIEAEKVTEEIGGFFDSLGQTEEFWLEIRLKNLSKKILSAETVDDVRKRSNELIEAIQEAFKKGIIDANQFQSAINAATKLQEKQLQYLQYNEKVNDEIKKANEQLDNTNKKQSNITDKIDESVKAREKERNEIERLKKQLNEIDKQLSVKGKEVTVTIIKNEIDFLKQQLLQSVTIIDARKIKNQIDKLLEEYKNVKIAFELALEKEKFEKDFTKLNDELQDMVEKGVISREEKERRLIEFEVIKQKELNLKTKEIETKTQEEIIKIRTETNELSKKQIQQHFDDVVKINTETIKQIEIAQDTQQRITEEQIALLAEIQQKRVEALQDVFEQGKDLFKEHTAAYKALALAQAIIATYEGAAKAIAKVEIFPLNLVLAATVIAQGLAMVAKIASVGFRSGGYTGDGASDEPAGIVHKGEFVLRREVVDQNRKWLEELNQRGGVSLEKMVEERSRFVMRHEVQQIVREVVQRPVQVVVQPASVDLEPLRQELAAMRREMRKQKETLQRVQLHIEVSDQELIRRIENRRAEAVRYA